MSKPTRLLVVLTLFIVYTIGCVHFAIQAGGAGHGTLVFFAPLISWPLLLIVALAIGVRFGREKLIAFTSFLGAHQLLTAALVVGYFMDGGELFIKMWSQSAELLFGGISWYVIGQMALWVGLLRSSSTEQLS